MLALYLFCAALGIPLLAVFAFGGGDSDADVGGLDADADVGGGFDADADVGSDFDVSGGHGIGDVSALLRRVPISSYTFFLSFFGAIGSLGTWLDWGTLVTFVLAVVMGVVASSVNTAMFSYLRKTDISSHFTDASLEGRLATVSVPIEDGRRGRVWLDTGDERLQLTAGAVDRESIERFAPGDRVVIVEVHNGIAHVMRADPELGL